MNDIARPLETIEAELHFYKQQASTSIIEIGKRLREAKQQLQHGEWGKWLEEKAEFSREHASRIMKVSQEYSNVTSMSHLGTKKLFLLLDIPTEEREQFVQENKVDEMTTRQLESAIKATKQAETRAENAEMETKLALDRAREAEETAKREKERADIECEIRQKIQAEPPKVVEKEVERIVVPGDYEQAKSKFAELTGQLNQTQRELETLKKYRDHNEQQAKEYQELKSKIEYMKREKSDIARQIESATEFAGLTVELEKILKEKLAPIKYSRIMERMDSDVAVKNLTEIVEKVEAWCYEIRSYLPQGNIIEMEVVE